MSGYEARHLSRPRDEDRAHVIDRLISWPTYDHHDDNRAAHQIIFASDEYEDDDVECCLHQRLRHSRPESMFSEAAREFLARHYSRTPIRYLLLRQQAMHFSFKQTRLAGLRARRIENYEIEIIISAVCRRN